MNVLQVCSLFDQTKGGSPAATLEASRALRNINRSKKSTVFGESAQISD